MFIFLRFEMASKCFETLLKLLQQSLANGQVGITQRFHWQSKDLVLTFVYGFKQTISRRVDHPSLVLFNFYALPPILTIVDKYVPQHTLYFFYGQGWLILETPYFLNGHHYCANQFGKKVRVKGSEIRRIYVPLCTTNYIRRVGLKILKIQAFMCFTMIFQHSSTI